MAEFLAQFRVQFAQHPGARVFELYCTGLLTEHPNEIGDTLAQVVPATSERQLNAILT